MNSRLRIVLLGYIVRCPVGGMAWSHLMYMLGLRGLGHDVWFLEDSGDSIYACYDPATYQTGPDPAAGLAFAKDAFDRLGMGECWAYHDALAGRWHGPAGAAMPDILKTADLVIVTDDAAKVLAPDGAGRNDIAVSRIGIAVWATVLRMVMASTLGFRNSSLRMA